jgi:hypothetical protein
VKAFAQTADITGVVVPKSKLNPRLVENESFMYEKVFGEQRFLATGILDLPPGASKPPKSSQDNAYVGVNQCDLSVIGVSMYIR